MSKRVRKVGRDFDLYLFDDKGEVVDARDTTKPAYVELKKVVASTGCSFSSDASHQTIVDKSTGKNGVKVMERIEWSFSSDYNVSEYSKFNKLLAAHKDGVAIRAYLMEFIADDQDYSSIDADGSRNETTPDHGIAISGTCVIRSISLNAVDGQLATFSMTLEGEGDYKIG